jgi:hypothetical protein
MKKQNGGGFTFDQKDVIGGQMSRVSYSDCDSPSYYNKFQVYDVQNGGSKKSKKTQKKRLITKSRSRSNSKSKKVKRSVRKHSNRRK